VADGDPIPGLFSKQGAVIVELAGALLEQQLGARTAGVVAYARAFDAGVGTVQGALEHVQHCGAARLATRGRLGSVLVAADRPLLWRIARQRPVRALVPLPYSRRLAGLATGIRAQFEAHRTDLDMRYLGGAPARLAALATERCDWVIVSRHAFERIGAVGDVVLNLGAGSALGEPVLVLRRGISALGDGLRVGVDVHSPDHQAQVEAACRGHAVIPIAIDYARGPALLHDGTIDATIWSHEDIPADLPGCRIVPLAPGSWPAATSEAIVVTRPGDQACALLLADVLDAARIVQTQQAVLAFEQAPAH
jgi:hypothetical protein